MNPLRPFSARLALVLCLGALAAVPARAQFLFGTKSTDGTMAANSDNLIPTQKAVVTYVAAHSVPFTTLTVTESTGTLTIANAKTFTVSNTLTLAGTDSTTMTFPSTSGTVVTTAATQTLTGKTLTAPTINGGTHTAITSLGIRSTGTGAFDVTLANAENLTAGRTLTIATGDAARTLTLSGNPTISGITTTGTGTLALGSKTLTASNTLTLAGTDGTTMTFPSTSATIARTDAANTFTGNQTFSGFIKSTSATAGIGYATGAGGAQTQATDKSTAVTSNTVTTAITLNNAELAAGAVVSFTFTNSAIAATDQVIVTHQSAGTNGAYTFNAFPAAGSASIAVRNVTAGALSEAIVLRVTVIKAVSS